MSNAVLARRFVLSTTLVLFVSVINFSQTPVRIRGGDPSEKPINAKAEPNDAFKKWATNDVPYILTEAERRAFAALKTDEERENFITNFWRNRDPDPETEENEYRDQYYERIAYANEHFASGVPGWRTDRGRIYIVRGKPDSIEAHPSGGAYDRPSYEGAGSTTTYPFETWFYRHLDGVGDGIEIEFVDQTGTGEYRIARDANEKDALATIPGARTRSNNNDNTFMREQDMPLVRLSRLADLETPPRVRFSDLDPLATASSGVVFDQLGVDLRVDFFRQSDDRVMTAFTVQADNKDLKFSDEGGLQAATLNIFGRITAVSGRRSGIFEDSVTTNATSDELISLKGQKSVYQKAVALTPGTYKVDVVVRDVGTGNRGIVKMGFVVPRYDDKTLSTSSLVLASKLRTTTERDIGQPFVIGDAKVVPNLSGAFKKGQDVGVYLQVYNARIDQTTLRPSVDVEYILSRSGKEIMRQSEDWRDSNDSGSRLKIARILPTSSLPVGDYEITVKVIDRSSEKRQPIETKGKFTIIN